MLRKIIVALCVVLMAFSVLVAVSGCGEEKVNETQTEQSDPVKVETEKGEYEVNPGADEKKITAVPIFPGARRVEDEDKKTEKENVDKPDVMSAAVYTTDEPFTTVAAWYRDTLSGREGFKEETSSLEDQQMAIFMFKQADSSKMVTITGGDKEYTGQTVICICSGEASELDVD